MEAFKTVQIYPKCPSEGFLPFKRGIVAGYETVIKNIFKALL